MGSTTRDVLIRFLELQGQHVDGQSSLCLLGGSALCLLGSRRTTVDIDYMTDLADDRRLQMQNVVAALATEPRLDVDEVPLAEFVPLPPGAQERRRLVGHYGPLAVYLYDLYTIALSKIARGFEADLEDVGFLLEEGLIGFPELEQHYGAVLPFAPRVDIIPAEFADHFSEVKARYGSGSP
jgi:hypothetical protein